ncbi:MAG: HD domain-containing protein [Nitrospiraceae bacterium]
MKDQRIRDPIHNLIKFSNGRQDDRVLWKLVQTRELQRLRRIKQLGFSDLVYPGATHTRFSHALGAMQMARRMLAVLKRNQFVKEGSPDSVDEQATLCAALLHDVGHGPLSHVFEEVSEQCGIRFHHEEWTRKIIEEGEIGNVLKETCDELHKRTLLFFETDPAYDVFSSIVSSQLDADRLDFMLRDRYFTGVQFGTLDPEWLFDCLTIQQIDIDPRSQEVKTEGFVVSSKGFSTIENYLYAYSELYSKVYFHKTTRAAQAMVKQILTDLVADLSLVPATNPFRIYFESKPEPSLETYINLDDNGIWAIVQFLADSRRGKISEISRRLLDRDLYKCFELPKRPKEEIPLSKANAFERKLRENQIWHERDRLRRKGYKEFGDEGIGYLKNILVYSEGDRAPVPMHVLSRWVQEMPVGAPHRYYFQNDRDRQHALEVWKGL